MGAELTGTPQGGWQEWGVDSKAWPWGAVVIMEEGMVAAQQMEMATRGFLLDSARGVLGGAGGL